MIAEPNQQDVLSYLEGHRRKLIDFTCALVATPSMNPPGDERAIAEVIRRELHALGLEDIEIVAREPERQNVLCRIRGREGSPVLLFNGHVDTKPVGDSARGQWKTDPLTPTLVDGRMYGLGTTDMKSGVAAMIYAAGALKAIGAPLSGDLLCAFTADEEAGSEYGATYLVKEYGLTADVGLISEPCGITEDFEQLCIASRGSLCFRTRVRGTQMHSSISDLVPSVNASVKLAGVLCRMNDEMKIRHVPHPLYPTGPTKNIGVTVEGGVYYGVCPGYAEFRSDIRLLPGMTPAGVARDVREFLDLMRAEDSELQVDIIEELTAPESWERPHPEVAADEPFVRMLLKAGERVLDRTLPLGGFPGGTDAYSLHGLGGIPTIPAAGPGLLPLAHGPNEYVTVERVVQASKMYALAALDYLC